MSSVRQKRYYSPPELAALWGIKAERVIGFIRNGELRAVDLSANPGIGRPRFKIPMDAITEFENRRAGCQREPTPRRRRRKDPEIIEYF